MKPVPQLHAATPGRLLVLISLLMLVALAPATVAAAKKIPDSAWQTGTLRNVTNDTNSRLVGMYNNGYGMVGEKVRIVWHYIIDAGQYVYESERTTRRHDKPLNLTINGPVKFAVDGMDLYLRDEDGKVHKLTIATKTLKPENGSSK